MSQKGSNIVLARPSLSVLNEDLAATLTNDAESALAVNMVMSYVFQREGVIAVRASLLIFPPQDTLERIAKISLTELDDFAVSPCLTGTESARSSHPDLMVLPSMPAFAHSALTYQRHR